MSNRTHNRVRQPPSRTLRKRSVALVCILMVWLACPLMGAQAQEPKAPPAVSALSVQQPLPALRLKDQHDKAWDIPPDVAAHLLKPGVATLAF